MSTAAPAQPTAETLMTPRELASYFRVSMSTVRTWAREGRIPVAFKAGNTRRYRLEDVQAAVNGKLAGNSMAS